jgi:hypothetical protein
MSTTVGTTGAAIQKKIQEKADEASTTAPGDDWGGFFASIGRGLLVFAVFSILGVNIGYIMKRQGGGMVGKVPVDEKVAPYGAVPDNTVMTREEMGTIRAYMKKEDEAMAPARAAAAAAAKDVAEVGEALRGGSNGLSQEVNPPLSIAYLGAKGGLIQQSWAYKEAKNPGSLHWILWEWFRNSAAFSWLNSRAALKSTMTTLNESMGEWGVLTLSYVLMTFWPVALLLLLGLLATPYFISLAGVLMTTFTKWTSYWQLAVNLILTFMLQGITLVPPIYATGEVLALLRYLALPVTHNVFVGGVERNNLWHQLKANYMTVWFFLFLSISISAIGNLSTATSSIINIVIVLVYFIMWVNYRLANKGK